MHSEFERPCYLSRMKTILTPVDFSRATAAVVNEAQSLARAFSARIVLLSIIQPPMITNDYAPLIDNLAEIVAAGEKAAALNLERLRSELETGGIPVETIQLNGAPISHIVEQAKNFAADYIVMGSHGHTALYDLLVGSTTHGVLLRASCPVIIVPAAKN